MTKYDGFYKCKWPGPTGGVCGCEFTARFSRITSNGGGCSVVKCPKCGHHQKPMQDAITLKEIDEKKGKVMSQ